MQTDKHIPTAEAIIHRADRIGLPITRLASEAGLNKSTASRWRSAPTSQKTDSLIKMARRLEFHERELLTYLKGMYPENSACGKTSGRADEPHAERQVRGGAAGKAA